MKVQQTLAQTWKRRRDSDHATAKRLIEERGVGLLRVPDELLDLILGYSDLRTRFAADAILWSWSIYPFVFFILTKTENRWMGFVSVLFAYGAWGFVNAIGCVVAMEAVRSSAWSGVVLWFGAAAAWNACLFCRRPPLRRAKVA